MERKIFGDKNHKDSYLSIALANFWKNMKFGH